MICLQSSTNLNLFLFSATNDHVLGIIKDGYKIPVLTEPEECILKNNKSALDHSEFVESENNRKFFSIYLLETRYDSPDLNFVYLYQKT
jgi:hypothetical protein